MHLCEIESPQDLPNLEFPFNVRKGRPLLVAVKILRPDASKNARSVARVPSCPNSHYTLVSHDIMMRFCSHFVSLLVSIMFN